MLILAGLAAASWALVVFNRWRADRRWLRRYASVPTPTPQAVRVRANAADTTAPAQQAVASQPAPAPDSPRRRSAEDLNLYDE